MIMIMHICLLVYIVHCTHCRHTLYMVYEQCTCIHSIRIRIIIYTNTIYAVHTYLLEHLY